MPASQDRENVNWETIEPAQTFPWQNFPPRHHNAMSPAPGYSLVCFFKGRVRRATNSVTYGTRILLLLLLLLNALARDFENIARAYMPRRSEKRKRRYPFSPRQTIDRTRITHTEPTPLPCLKKGHNAEFGIHNQALPPFVNELSRKSTLRLSMTWLVQPLC